MLQTPRGTQDILPEDQKYWQKIEKTFEKVASSTGFEKIETPYFEYRKIFEKGIGTTVKTFFQEIGLKNLAFEVNSLGCPSCRSKMRKVIVNYYQQYLNVICASCKNRFEKNPMRLLDCKEAVCQEVISGAPALIDSLCTNCKEHFKSTLEFLDEMQVPYDFNPRLVRGLDYYTKTIFEVVPQDKTSSLGGGGRYDNLIESFGGQPIGAIGVSFGIERIILEIKKQEIEIPETPKLELFLVQLGDLATKKSLSLLFKLYNQGFRVSVALEKTGLKSQLKVADRLKVPYSLILGQREARDNTIIVRNMLDGSQDTIDLKKLMDYLKKRLFPPTS
ncbi:MAG: HisS family protein [Candidatus Berkelbacteria bacterium]|nr:HisS family protein [Candidatus Berkelbacteria bacterium]